MKSTKLQILQHSLGLDQYGCGPSYRNHFCAGGDDILVCEELVQEGLMERFGVNFVKETQYRVTKAGKEYIHENSPKPPKLTRSQKRYREFLRSDCSMSFGRWLKEIH